MKKIKKIIKKALLISLVSLEIVLINIQPTQAGLGSLLGGILGSKGSAAPNANGMLNQMEERYHLNKDSIKNFGEGFNVSDQKSPAPEVDIFFDPANPKFGEKITATAIPKYFQEGIENMYFTWYLKHEGCDETRTVNGENQHCDADNNGVIDTSDWKVEAMRLIASNGFIKEKADYGTDSDNDGYSAHRGGRVNIQEIDYCYAHDFSSGEDYEIATASDGDNDDEDGFDCKNEDGTDGTVMCTSPYTLSCGVLDATNDVPAQDLGTATATGGDGSTTDGDSSSSGGDVSVDLAIPAHEEVLSGITVESLDAHTDSGYAPSCNPEKTCKDGTQNCAEADKKQRALCPEGTTARCIKDEDLDLIDPKCSGTEAEATGTLNLSTSDVTIVGGLGGADVHPYEFKCYEDGRSFARFPEKGMSYCGNGGAMDSPPGGECTVTLNTSDGLQTWTFTNPGGPSQEPHPCDAANRGCPGRYEGDNGFLWKSVGDSTHILAVFFPAEFSEGCSIANPGETDFACTTTLYEADEVDLKCEHQFAKVAGMEVGDGDFGADEEEFWGTDPNNPSTAGNGNNDEANVAGLGQDKLTWTFLPGDKVGVVVEGLSYMGTKHDDSSNAISFALVNNIFHKDGDVSAKGNPLCQIIKQEKYVEKIKGYDVEIPFAKVDISDCLKYNLVAPTDGYQADNMEMELDYYPKNPSVGAKGVDGSGQSMGGDNLTVSSNTADPNLDTSQIYYKWSIYGFAGERGDLELDINAWTNLSNDSDFRSKNSIKLLEGLGMDQFEMQLNDVGDYRFLRFFAESEEFFNTGTGTTGTTRSGRSDIMVELNTSNSSSGMNIKTGDTNICINSGDCEVFSNQLITVTLSAGDVSNYLWTLDGKNVNTLSEGETKQGNSVSFVLEGNPGDYHTLNVIANDTASPGSSGNTGEKLNISRNFIVTKPMVGIGPNNEINRGDVSVAGCLNLNGEIDSSAVLGTYQTIETGAAGTSVSDCRENVFNGSGSITLTPTYYPEWIVDNLKNVKYYVNGTLQEGCTTAASCDIDLSAYPVGSTVNISYEAEYWETDENRVELKNWGVSEGASSGIKISDSIMAKVTEPANQTVTKKASKIIAGLAYNIPEQMIFMFRMILTAAVIIFAAGVVMSLGKRKYN